MKLSRKIGMTYIIALIIAVCVCVTYFIFFIKAGKDGERLRSAEISQGVRSRMESKIDEINDRGKLYKNLIDNGEQYEVFNKLSTDNDSTSSSIIDYGVIVDINKGDKNSFFGKDKSISYTNVIDEIVKHIKSVKSKGEKGIIGFNDKCYIIDYLELKEENKYVVLVRDMDEKFLDYMGSSTNSKASLTKDLDKGLFKNSMSIEGIKYIFDEDSKNIYSYSLIETLNNSNDIYLKNGLYKQVEETITINFIILITVIFVIVIGINAVLYLLINKKVIKRIIFVNNAVHKVDGSDYEAKKIFTTGIKDEITDLSISINDMLDRVQYANSKLKASENKYSGIINTMTNGFIYCKLVLINDKIDGVIVDINDAAIDMLCLSEWEGKAISSVFTKQEIYKDIIINAINNLKDKAHIEIEKEVEVASNCWGFITITMIEDGYFFIIINDITKIKLYSEKMKYLASYDHLTSIYNRRKLLSYINELEKRNQSYSFFYMDLDDFKKINDTLGHDIGDEVLKDVSQNLITIKSKHVKIARLGGDEFVVVVEGDYNEDEIEDFGEKVINAIAKRYQFNDFIYDLKASIGVSRYPIDGLDNNTIIKYADIAMYNSKLKGGNTISIFNKEIKEIYELENRIKEGIIKQEFIPYFQPIYNVKTKSIDGVEALIRWKLNNTIVAPDRFLSVAKRNGLMAELDKIMFISACEFTCRWKERYGNYPYISVNISNSLLIKKEFVQFILGTIQDFKIPAEFIKLEITEDELISDMKYVVSIIDYLRDLGVKIALDDFGTGYSSYNYINTLPVDLIKIDRSLVMNIENDEKSWSIVQSLIELSKSLEIESICEGIENYNQLKIISELGCDKVQGYVFSRPIPENELFLYVDKFEITQK